MAEYRAEMEIAYNEVKENDWLYKAGRILEEPKEGEKDRLAGLYAYGCGKKAATSFAFGLF